MQRIKWFICLLGLQLSLVGYTQAVQPESTPIWKVWFPTTYQSVRLAGFLGETIAGSTALGGGCEVAYGIEVLPALRIGAGAGIDYISWGVSTKRVVPLYSELQWLPVSRTKHQPFLLIDVGHAWAWKDKETLYREVKGGLRLHGGIGMAWKVGGIGHITTELGLLRQRTETVRDNFWWWGGIGSDNFIRETNHLNRWMFRIGWNF